MNFFALILAALFVVCAISSAFARPQDAELQRELRDKVCPPNQRAHIARRGCPYAKDTEDCQDYYVKCRPLSFEEKLNDYAFHHGEKA